MHGDDIAQLSPQRQFGLATHHHQGPSRQFGFNPKQGAFTQAQSHDEQEAKGDITHGETLSAFSASDRVPASSVAVGKMEAMKANNT